MFLFRKLNVKLMDPIVVCRMCVRNYPAFCALASVQIVQTRIDGNRGNLAPQKQQTVTRLGEEVVFLND